MQRTTRQGPVRDSIISGNDSSVATGPSFPLLRMSLVATINHIVAISTLTWIPKLLIGYNNDKTDTSKGYISTGTLPSLSWTLVALFIAQTGLGLVQWQLHASNQAGTKKGPLSSRSQSSSSFFSIFSTSMAIGAVGILICHIFAVLFGAGIIQQAKETSQLASYLSLLTFYPASFVLGADLESWLRVFIHSSPRTYTETAFYCQGMMAIFGAWLGSIVIPLDWDRPWQAWPVPCVLGAGLFYCIGTVVGLVVSVAMRQRAMRREFGIIDGKAEGKKKVKTG